MIASTKTLTATCGAFCLGSLTTLAVAQSQYPPLEPILTTQTTVIGQPIAYPDGSAEITSAIVTLQPGQETGLHSHNVPLFGYVLEGSLELDYGAHGKHSLNAGEAIIEAIDTVHNGKAVADQPTRVLVVFMGSEGIANTVAQQN